MTRRVSLSLPDEDVEFLDAYAESQGIGSRSGAMHKAVRLLRVFELGSAYQQAWGDWASSEDAHLWDHTSRDELS